MDYGKLEGIKREIDGFRRSQPKARDLEGLAKQLGRHKIDRGKEPTYVSTMFKGLRPLSIPNHKGRDMPPGTKHSILDQLEDDVLRWEEWLTKQEQEGKGEEAAEAADENGADNEPGE